MRKTRSFEHTPGSATAARRFATHVLRGAPADVLDAVELMVSELASNSIRHTDSGFDLTVIVTEDEIRVEVTDRGGGEPQMRNPAPTDPTGRGLQIVNMLASQWGVDHLSDGKTVWLTLNVEASDRVQAASA